MNEPSAAAPSPDLVRWAEALAGIARTGLAFTQSLYDRERFEEVLRVAADIRAAAGDAGASAEVLATWRAAIARGIEGYVTPKSAVGAIVGNERGELLLGRRSDDGHWYYPVGWIDRGYSPAEVVVKEVREEAGLDVEPVGVVAVVDGLRREGSVPFVSVVFHCRLLGGELRHHPLEATDVGFFSRGALPEPLRWDGWWVDWAFAAIDGTLDHVVFDPPRRPPWRGAPGPA